MYPEKQSRLRDELLSFSTTDSSYDDLMSPALPYLEAVVREALRLHPILNEYPRVVRVPPAGSGFASLRLIRVHAPGSRRRHPSTPETDSHGIRRYDRQNSHSKRDGPHHITALYEYREIDLGRGRGRVQTRAVVRWEGSAARREGIPGVSPHNDLLRWAPNVSRQGFRAC